MRTIDADYLIKRLNACDTLKGIGLEPVMALRDVKALISVMPTIDAAPVVHGRWEYIPGDGKFRAILICSRCRRNVGAYNRFNYCPYCGAKMDLGREDGFGGKR